MNPRLILAIISSLLDEAIIIALIVWGLPRLGINIPLGWLIVIAVVFAVFAVASFRIGSQVLARKPLPGLTDMSGMRGRVVKMVSPLKPSGHVRIMGELWEAQAEDDTLDIGTEIIVLRQEGLKLTVRQATDSDDTD